MSNRNTILKQLAGDPQLLADLVDATGWPERKVRDTCARHRTIKMDAGLGPYAVTTRACRPDEFDMHIEVEY